MNYGKLAYQALGDVKSRMEYLERAGENGMRVLTRSGVPAGSGAGPYALAPLRFTAGERQAALCEAELFGAFEGVSAAYTAYVNGTAAASGAFEAAANGAFSAKFALAGLPAGRAALTVEAAFSKAPGEVTGGRVTLTGTGIAEDAGDAKIAADTRDGRTVTAVAEEGVVTVAVAGKTLSFPAAAFDAALLEDGGVALAYADARGRARLIELDAALAPQSLRFLGEGVTDLSLLAPCGAHGILVLMASGRGVEALRAEPVAAAEPAELLPLNLPRVTRLSGVKGRTEALSFAATCGSGMTYLLIDEAAQPASAGETLSVRLTVGGGV